MNINKAFDFSWNGGIYSISGTIDEPSSCPICQHAIKPHQLVLVNYRDEDEKHYITGLYLCKHCYQTFVTLYSCSIDSVNASYHSELLYAAPMRFKPKDFDDGISSLSPQFVKIYNQSLAAETQGLDEIAGLGYRKALEFLIKDFCIHLYPDDEENIKKTPLAQCIKTYISSTEIKTLASRAAWIGNDEAHYIRKQEGRDVSDMKKFITAAVYFIGMVLITEDAAGMSPS